MPKTNPDNLPVVYARTSLEDFFCACMQRRYSVNRDYEGDALGVCRDVTEHFDLNKHETSFKYHREQQGFSKSQMAKNLCMPVNAYIDIEEGEDEPSRDFIIAFCHFMDLHPADLIVEFNGAMNPAFLNILLHCYEVYKTSDKENDLDIINQQKMADIVEILAEEGDACWSYDMLHKERSDCVDVSQTDDKNYTGAMRNAYSYLARFIDKLLVNDGNPNILIDDIIEAEKTKIENSFNYTEGKFKKSAQGLVVIQQRMDDLGQSFFGNKWNDHKHVLNTCYSDFFKSDFNDFFLNDLPWPKEIGEKDKKELRGLFQSEKIKRTECDVVANEFLRDKEIRECVEAFLDSWDETLKIYSNRQTILEKASDLVNEVNGEPENLMYVRPAISWDVKNLRQKPAGLLPKP